MYTEDDLYIDRDEEMEWHDDRQAMDDEERYEQETGGIDNDWYEFSYR